MSPVAHTLAEKLRQLILNDAMDALTEAYLIFAARRDHVNQVIAPALARGDVLLCDRFTDATFAYQGGGRGFDLNVLSTLEQWTQTQNNHLLQPQLTLWFDLPAEVAAERLAGARVPDKFEAQPVGFFRQWHMVTKSAWMLTLRDSSKSMPTKTVTRFGLRCCKRFDLKGFWHERSRSQRISKIR